MSALGLALGACASAGGARTHGAPSPRAALRQAIDSMVEDPKFRSAHWGVLIVDPARRDTLYSHNAGKLFIPASNEKLLTGSVATHLLGPDYRFRTTFAASGPVVDGTLRGDLVVIGRGDPSVSDHMQVDAMRPLRAVADSLATRGIRRIGGQLVKGGDAFPDANLGYGWSWDDLDYPYAARVDELMFNEGFTRVLVRAGAGVGTAPAVATAPSRTFPQVRVVATTVARGATRRGGDGLVVLQDSSGAGLIVSGAIALGDSAELTISYRDPAVAYLAALREALDARGIRVDGGRIDDRPAAGDGATPARLRSPDTLFTLWSPPLRTVLIAFEKPSQNQIGELLLKTLGLERTGVGTADSGARVVQGQLLAWGAQRDGFVVRDGSGLSRHDVVTPETIVRVLSAMRSDTAFHAFYDALPIAGVDGTIVGRMRGTRAQGNVHAKTGFVDLARSLSGYVTTADGHPLVFSVLANNWTTDVREIERVQDAIAIRLAELTLGSR